MKYLSILLLILLSACTKKEVTTKTCYELTLTFNLVNSKQVVCTDKPLVESYHFRLLPQQHQSKGTFS